MSPEERDKLWDDVVTSLKEAQSEIKQKCGDFKAGYMAREMEREYVMDPMWEGTYFGEVYAPYSMTEEEIEDYIINLYEGTNVESDEYLAGKRFSDNVYYFNAIATILGALSGGLNMNTTCGEPTPALAGVEGGIYVDGAAATGIPYYSGTMFSTSESESVQKNGNYEKVKDNYLKQNNIDAHELKKDFLGKNAQISKYDIYVNKDTGELFIFGKGGKGAGIATGEFIK